MSTTTSTPFLNQFVLTVGGLCVKRFQLAYPVALLVVPGWLYRSSSSGMVEAFAWTLLGLGAILIVAGLLARPIETGCASKTATRALYPAIACAAAGIGSGVIAGKTTGAMHVAALVVTIVLVGAAAVMWTLVDAGRTINHT